MKPKRISSILSKLALLAALLLAPSSGAADYNPPEQMTYQGFLADANGVGLAPTNPLNYDAIFRIYDSQSGGNLLWAESQIITIDKGVFSVLLGQGSQNGSEPRPVLSSLFLSPTASDRFIAINVKVGANSMDILPRLRLVPSAYSFLARNANNLVDSRGVNVINTVSPGLVGINKTPTTALDVNGTVTATAINSSGTSLFGTVGINTASPTGKLHVNGGVAITGASSPYAPGTAGLFTEFGGTGRIFAYDYGAGTPKPLLLQSPGGSVGIGSQDPGLNLLQVGTRFHAAAGFGLVASSPEYGANIQIYRAAGQHGVGLFVDNHANGDVAQLLVLRNNVGNAPQNQFVVYANGYVTVGGHSPNQKLDVDGNIYSRNHIYADGFIYNRWGGVYYALQNGGQNNTVIWNTSDERLKTDVHSIENALDTLGRLRGVSYQWNDAGLEHLTRDIQTMYRSASGTEEDNQKLWAEKKEEALKRLGTRQTGFVAQELEKVFPSWVRTDDKGFKQINVEQLAGVIVQGVNELRQKTEAQAAELEQLRSEVAQLRKANETFEARFTRLEKSLFKSEDTRELSQVAR